VVRERCLEPPGEERTEASDECFHEFASRFKKVPAGRAVILEDKSPSESWERDELGYQSSILDGVENSGWEETGYTEQQADSAIRLRMVTLLPARFAFFKARIIAWHKVMVPYVYTSVKRKCYEDGKKLCEKIGHSCERKIVSFVALWGRAFLRIIHRAC
jgi:hypothetical protein